MDAHLKRVRRVEDQGRLGSDIRGSRDARNDQAVADVDRALENAADDAFLPPDFALADLAVLIETGKLGTRAGPAWRAVICLSGTEDEVLAVGRRMRRRSEQFDVINL